MAMNFFQHQEAARRSSRVLIVLLILAVIAIVLAVNLALAAAYLLFIARLSHHGNAAHFGFSALPKYFFEANTAVVLFIIVGGAVQQILELRDGGEAVARMVRARPIDPGTRVPVERRLINVIEEMALASGIAAPRAYVLDGESGINAFVAGMHPSDAVITVTHGALTRLTRDELQGVVGHEFSHILNGDMGLNLRLIGVLQGLLSLALFGRFLVSIGTDRPNKGTALPAVAGLVVLAVGSIGVFFGRLIKASVSRQREFLADASSVQFTRNPDGIGGALRKIGGLGADAGGAVQHIHAETLSHMFMAPASVALAGGLLASHPPLKERLRRIYGRWVEYLHTDEIADDQVPAEPVLAPLEYQPTSVAGAQAALLSPLASTVGSANAQVAAATEDRLHASMGQHAPGGATAGVTLTAQVETLGLRPALGDALQAQLLATAMLLDQDTAVRARQLSAAVDRFGHDAAPSIERYAGILATLPPGWRLPLLDLSMPVLRTLAPGQRDALLRLARALIEADGRVTLAEFLLYSVLQRRLAPARSTFGPGRALRLDDVAAEATVVMSLVACVRLPQEPQRAFDAGKALVPAVGPLVPQQSLKLAQVSAAFDRLAGLAPLQKPLLVKACIAIAFVDGHSVWRALSCLRTLCAALDCPMPPQVESQS